MTSHHVYCSQHCGNLDIAILLFPRIFDDHDIISDLFLADLSISGVDM